MRERVGIALRSLKDRDVRTERLTERALRYVTEHGCTSVALFLSVGSEPDTSALFSALRAKKIAVSVPVVTSGTEMAFSLVSDDTVFRKGAFGIPEPVHIVERRDFDVMFVPLVAFDENCHRLGHGKGYYDRYFAENIGPATKKIGLAFAEQKVPVLPVEKTDVRLDAVFYE